jgi:hypothetical protein
MAQAYQHTTAGGSDIVVVLEFPTILIGGEPAVLTMASAISVSYSVYRAKSSVYNMGQPLLGGMAIGRKYVAGSIITVAYEVDEISEFINLFVDGTLAKAAGDNAQTSSNPTTLDTEITNQSIADSTLKNIHTVMRDDLTPFNIHFLISDENTGQAQARQVSVYGCQFINNGQVMSINDIITENTLGFIGRDVREQRPIDATTQSLAAGLSKSLIVGAPVQTATQLLSKRLATK